MPAEAETAKEGQWLDGPKTDFFDAVNRTFKNPKIIAEDLGIIDDGVIDLLEKTQLPCMRVMQFAFMEGKDNMHMPHNYPKNCVAYTGTHDNNTVLGWLWEAQPYEREHALKYCAFPGGDWAVGGSEVLLATPSSARCAEPREYGHCAGAGPLRLRQGHKNERARRAERQLGVPRHAGATRRHRQKVAQRIKRCLLQKQITAKGRRVSVGFCLANF